ncbi:MAG: NAD(+) synthetase [Candidatus Altiarchaeales archaeon]|nr:MAG: NAD(+) synthetase [Candidatus Altiarchaeales archaeon]RLI93878.1 MAG: NAD(+) synthetase [Candidatus Altiarchaeales archaeon]RLI94450.1 MAG: NAD(+) synthetase [Candidatus Altiarchaeales archaeon]HDO82255.1 NAD+ synthase [Candidatus Altiarchaeales archaeon]HEX54904.1 NAD+ synthase [Candidatus Altiarchaeales archaeon]
MGLKLTKEQMRKFRRIIEKRIAEIVRESKSKGVVLGVSGGIDSSVVLKLASESVDDVYALIMPERGLTKRRDVEDAINLSRELNVMYEVIEINPILNSIINEFPWNKFDTDEIGKIVSIGNVKARIRMILLYLVANIDNRIVLGTGNKTEMLLGYGTKHGDLACDIKPIGDLYKTQVMQFAEFLGIPRGIIEKEPSAGLWEGQTDEKELGISYEIIDRILYMIFEKNYEIEEVSDELEIPIDLVKNLDERIKRNEHKRELPTTVKLF